MRVPERNISVHCQELVTGRKLTGIFQMTDRRIVTDIFGYDEWFYLKPDKPLHIQTADNKIVSLFHNISSPPGSSSRLIEPKMHSLKQHIVSNFAVVGHDVWPAERKVRRVTFSIANSIGIFRHEAKLDALAKGMWEVEGSGVLFSVTAGGCVVRAYYSAQSSGEFFGIPTEVWPTFEIEYVGDRLLADYMDDVACLTQFVSFCLGTRLRPYDIRVSQLTHLEYVAAVEAHNYAGDHEVEYLWPQLEADQSRMWPGGSPVISWDDHELAALQVCIGA